jgi:hypothetical protein
MAVFGVVGAMRKKIPVTPGFALTGRTAEMTGWGCAIMGIAVAIFTEWVVYSVAYQTDPY